MAIKKIKTAKGKKKVKAPAKSNVKARKEKQVKVKTKEKVKTKKIKTIAKKPKVTPAKPKTKKPSKVKTVINKTPSRAGEPNEREKILRRQLIQNRENIVREARSEIAKYVKGETRQLVETALDDGDWSVIDLSEDINLRMLETHRSILLRIDEALDKIKDGTYGICEDCGEKIRAERLKVMPFAIYCRDCQEKREELERVEREEEAT